MQYNFSSFKRGLKKAEEFLAKEYLGLNVGRAAPSVLDGILIDSYGSRVPLKNTASVSIEDPRTLRIAPWDKSQIKDIEKAIIVSNLGLSVSTDEQGIRVTFPQLTTENRKNLIKVLKEKLEEARIAVRREREHVWDDVQKKEKEGKLTEDEKFRAKEELQKIVDEVNKNLENLFIRKEKEVMGQ